MCVCLSISIKSGKVVIMLAGRYAGRKAVVVKVSEDGSSGKRFGNCIGELLCRIVKVEG